MALKCCHFMFIILQEMIQDEQKVQDPLLKLVYKEGMNNFSFIQPGLVVRKSITEDSIAPHLYQNIQTS